MIGHRDSLIMSTQNIDLINSDGQEHTRRQPESERIYVF